MSSLRRHPILSLIALAALAALAAFGVVYATLLADLPPVSSAEQRLVRPTSQILDRNGRLLYEVLDPNAGKQLSLSLEDVPAACVQAALATEDKRFYSHPGVDPLAIARAAWQNWRADGYIVSGASTITQQVARNLLLGADERYTQSYARKLREAWLALGLERRYSKDEVLALYLNQSYYGNFAFGLEAAAQIFFGKPARQLARGECALLAGLVQYPTGYNPLNDPEAARARRLTVLRLMREAGFIDEAEQAAIAAEPLRYKSNLFDIEAPHFVMVVQDLLVQRLGADRLRDGGLRVVTTLDLDLQREAEESVRRRLDLLNCRTPGLCTPTTDPNRRADNTAAVVLDSQTGDILALVGSPDYFDAAIQGNVNAALSLRQPGSAIKPFTYAVALDPQRSAALGLEALTPATILADLPTTFYVTDETGARVPYTPVNYDSMAHGPVSVRDALANSYNVPAVKVLDRIGVDALKQMAGDAGISTFTGDFGLALTLGGGEVRLLDLAAAFGSFDDGARLDPRAILAIDEGIGDSVSGIGKEQLQPYQATSFAVATNSLDPIPNTQYPITDNQPRVLSPAAAYLITDILSDNAARIPAFGAESVLKLPFPAAAKTGTTTDWRDNWTVGYTTRRIVGVWVGNADNTPMRDVSGVDGAGPIWHDLMLAAHRTPPPAFERPAAIVEELICSPSGLLPTRWCPRTRLERFIRGTEPTRPDDQFQPVTIDLATGLRADESTPPARRAERVFRVLPPEYHDWMVSRGLPLIPPAAATDAGGTALAARDAAPLVLTGPVSHTAYQIHPGVPRASQRIEVAGYADGGAWAELRLVVDGRVVAQAGGAQRLRAWWVLEPGEHRFRLEGQRTPGGPLEQSGEALVVVREFQP